MFNLFGKRKLFYIIDDDEDLSFILSKMLKKEFHCKIKLFSSLKEAMDVIEVTTPDCIISDILLPGENGLDLGIYLKKFPIKVPVIFVSAMNNPELIKNEVVLISKPINFERLFTMIKYNIGEI